MSNMTAATLQHWRLTGDKKTDMAELATYQHRYELLKTQQTMKDCHC